jgi:hypothetical protein
MPMTNSQNSPALRLGSVDEVGHANFPRLASNIEGRAVAELQARLHTLRFLLPKPDGVFGENTLRAVMAFQKEAGLSVDGVAGPATMAAITERAEGSKRSADPDRLYLYLREIIEDLGYKFDIKPLYLNLLGIRGFWHGQSVANEFNRYNDTIYAVWLDGDREPRVESFDASCDPGLQRQGQPNPAGVAHLMEGQYLFQRGLHACKYRALRQAGPVRVKRYFDDDPDRVRPTLDEGWFGINIHAAGTTDWVNGWSAGCQVIHGGVEGATWKRFDRLVYELADQSQKRIPYTLVSSQALVDRG